MIYDELIEKEYENIKIKYAIKYGNGMTVFIKSGKGGHIDGKFKGQANIYEELTDKINSVYGYSIIIVDNPLSDDRDNPLEEDFKFINNKFFDNPIVYIGNSSWANYGSWYGWQFSNINKMLFF